MTTKKKNGAVDAVEFLNKLIGHPLTLGSCMKNIRECEDWSMEDMARKLGCTRSFISMVEHGKPISPKLAASFAKKLGYSPEQFIRLSIQDELNRAHLPYDVQISNAA